MMKVNSYSQNYVEVLEILKHIHLDEYNKIPKNIIEYYEKNCDKSYVYEYDPNKISKKTLAILTNLYIDYIADDREKNLINQIIKINWNIKDSNNRKLYNPNSIFN